MPKKAHSRCMFFLCPLFYLHRGVIMSISLKDWIPPNKGALFVVTGPSGTGKTTLVHHALSQLPNISFSVSATTRAPHPNETPGKDYHFYDTSRFKDLVDDICYLWHANKKDNPPLLNLRAKRA